MADGRTGKGVGVGVAGGRVGVAVGCFPLTTGGAVVGDALPASPAVCGVEEGPTIPCVGVAVRPKAAVGVEVASERPLPCNATVMPMVTNPMSTRITAPISHRLRDRGTAAWAEGVWTGGGSMRRVGP